ncbi:MAG: hypothetical protein JO371_00135, partial [Paraburkholderia sp.]|nr:hypothetical protein [Paraburkholderia sp.]
MNDIETLSRACVAGLFRSTSNLYRLAFSTALPSLSGYATSAKFRVFSQSLMHVDEAAMRVARGAAGGCLLCCLQLPAGVLQSAGLLADCCSGRCLSIAWLLPGCCLAGAWRVPGGCMSTCGPSATFPLLHFDERCLLRVVPPIHFITTGSRRPLLLLLLLLASLAFFEARIARSHHAHRT